MRDENYKVEFAGHTITGWPAAIVGWSILIFAAFGIVTLIAVLIAIGVR